METSHLEENFIALIEDVNSMRPKRDGPFITKCCVVCLPLKERLKINYKKYIGEEESIGLGGEEEEDDEEKSDDEIDKEKGRKSATAMV